MGIFRQIPALTVALEEIPAEGLRLPLELSPEDVRELTTVEDQDAPKVSSPLRGELTLVRLDRRLRVRGSFQVEVELTCDRCLGPAPTELRAEVNEILLPVRPGEQAGEDDDPLPMTADGRADLTALLAELFWVAWPYRFICRPDCAGLCPECGTDLNSGPCGCPGSGYLN